MRIKISEKISKNDPVSFNLRITPEIYQKKTNSIIEINHILFRLANDLDPKIGELYQVSGRLEMRVTEEKNRQFWLINPQIKLIPSSQSPGPFSRWFWVKKIYLFSKHLTGIIKATLPEPHASLLAGIILGTKEKFPQDFYDQLITTGTLHIIAASGFNVTVVAKAVISLFTQFVRRRLATVLSILAILIYTVMAGMSEPVVRAAIMGSVSFLAQAFGRQYLAGWALFLSASVMALVNPSLLTNVSFQLSVAATAGIIWFEPQLSRLLDRWLKIKTRSSMQSAPSRVVAWAMGIKTQISTDLSTTLAATFAIIPITLIQFESISLISPLVNAMVLWLIPPLMFLGAVLAAAGLIWLPLAKLVALLTWPLLELFVQVINLWSQTPFALIKISGLSWLFAAGYYFLLLDVIWLTSRKK
ncbi:hypothetical protein A3A66_04635 [Microgenomates group bacterium RIFCSPLOWO2_01_FULL_46_13]|nr:MAG: hypothetical protein A2783_05110 [Microgenomates group bacterium RIFCSPHIGHO2_01_FULL_45_11]OGV94255.1 MAG: hypothetical protein A3A66_04635 [Microgenomates group bacterium RIFCSPLOWO2_01_FULL_46_13]